MPLRLFLHAFRTIFGNLREALVISVVPFGALFLLLILFGQTFETSFTQEPSGGVLFGIFVFVIAFIVAFGFVASSWHRFVLFEETPKILGSPAQRRAVPYIWKGILLGLWLLLFYIPITIVLGLVLVPVAGAANETGFGLLAIALDIVIGGVMGAIFFMYAMVLPASALEKHMTFKESRLATSRLGINLLWLGVLIAAFNTLMNVALGLVLVAGGGVIGSVLSLAIQWLVMMIGISILTTLYGHLVEGRDLPT